MSAGSNEACTINLKGLDQLLKALKSSAIPKIEIGVLGEKDSREDGGSNATIGAAHEFGTSTMVRRSFLRVPLETKLNKELKNSGLSDKDTLKAVIASGTVIPWLEKVALSAEAVVLDAFDNSGPGWAAWKNKNYENNTGMILTDTQQLRDSIGTRVKEAP